MTSRKISLDGKHQQLVEINPNVKFFSADIKVSPIENDMEKKYDIAITTQEKLDSGVDPKMSSISGVFQKSLSVTSGDYQSYCLIIKSNEVFSDIDININLEPIEDEVEEVVPTQQNQVIANEVHEQMKQVIKKRENGSKKIKYIIGALILLVGGFFLYHFWKSKNITSTTSESAEQASPAPAPALAPAIETPESVTLPVPIPKSLERSTFSFY